MILRSEVDSALPASYLRKSRVTDAIESAVRILDGSAVGSKRHVRAMITFLVTVHKRLPVVFTFDLPAICVSEFGVRAMVQ